MTSRDPGRRVPRTVAARATVVLALVAVATLAGCTSPRNVLGPSTSPCFRALPAAGQAVGRDAHFAGVRNGHVHDLLVVVQRRNGRASPVAPPAVLKSSSKTEVCLVGFRPPISPHGSSPRWKPWPGATKFVIVVVGEQNLHVVATILLDRPPLRFGRDFPVVR